MAATAGAMMFQKGGNAVDAAAAMLGATATMWDVLSWGGETQALIYHPMEKRVIGLNALGVAPTGATPEYFREKGMDFPPETGVESMVTPGTPGGLMTMVAEWGRLSLADVLAPAIQMAEGYPVEADAVRRIRGSSEVLKEWPYTAAVFFPEGEAPEVGEVLVQSNLATTLRKLVETEAGALAAGKSRKEAIYAAYDRFYRGDIAEEYVRGAREQGSTVTMKDLADWQVYIEEPVMTTYKGVEVYKLTTWVQGPVLLQALNILENFDLRSMGYNSARYIHALYQAMNLAFADRDFYYGDPYYPPEEPILGLLSKDYARERAKLIDWDGNDPDALPGDPYPFQGGRNPFLEILEQWGESRRAVTEASGAEALADFDHALGRLDSCGHRRTHGRVHEPTRPVLRGEPGGQSLQRHRARQTTPRHADPLHGPEGRKAVPFVRRAGRRRSGSESPPVLPERGGVRHERAAGGGGGEHQLLPDARVLRRARVESGTNAGPERHTSVGAGRAPPHGVRPDVFRAHLGPHQRHLLRLGARNVLGWVQPPRRRLRGGLGVVATQRRRPTTTVETPWRQRHLASNPAASSASSSASRGK
jgi:gamma-glutamyltranspeptidase